MSVQYQIENIFYEEISLHYRQYLFVLLVHCLSCMTFEILFFWHLIENPVLNMYSVLAKPTLLSLKIMIPGWGCHAKSFLSEIKQIRNMLYFIILAYLKKTPTQLISLNVFKELFSRPPAQDITFAIMEIDFDVNNKYMMNSGKRLRQLSLHTFFPVVFLSSKLQIFPEKESSSPSDMLEM